MIGLIAYVPYAAAGYCIAAMATDVWPTLRSAVGSASYPASRHGRDGSGLVSPRACDPEMARRNQALGRDPNYCYNKATGAIEGTGPMDGVVPPAGTVMIYTDEDGAEVAKINVSGDNWAVMLVCYKPAGVYTPPESRPEDPRFDYGDPYDPGGRGFCGPRRQPARGYPPGEFSYADCRGGAIWRNNDANRLRRKHARWG